MAKRAADVWIAPLPSRIAYVAYPSSLVLRSANAIQTYATVRALRQIVPQCDVLVPRFAFRPSRFTDVGATHLLRLPFNAGRHLVRSSLWSYAERTWFSARFLLWLLRHRICGAVPDAVYVRDVVCAAWLSLCAAVLRVRVVYEAHDLEAENRSANSGPVARWAARRLDRVALGRSDAVVSLTAAFVPVIMEYRAGWRPETVTVIPDAYDDAVFSPLDRTVARRTIGAEDDGFIVAYAGATFSYHGVDLLVDAFRLLVRDMPNARLLLVGGRDGERAQIRRQIGADAFASSVTVIPPQPVERIPSYLAAADVLVIPDTVTKASASPLKLFEYAAMARPIVAADIPALREILPDDAVRYVAPASASALADGLRWVAAHPREAHEMASRAYSAVEGYTYRARAAAIARFCGQIAESRR